jgi:hypothetical protein
MDQTPSRPAPLVGGAHRATGEVHPELDNHTLNRSPLQLQATLQASIVAEALRYGAIAKVGPTKSPSLSWIDSLDQLRRVFPSDDEYRRQSIVGEFVVFRHVTDFFGHSHVMSRRLPLSTLKLVIEGATRNGPMSTDALIAALAAGLFKPERKRTNFGCDWIANIANHVGDPLDRTRRIRIIDICAFPLIEFIGLMHSHKQIISGGHWSREVKSPYLMCLPTLVVWQ